MMSFKKHEIDESDVVCPFCGRLLWESVSEPGVSRLCESCDLKFLVVKRG